MHQLIFTLDYEIHGNGDGHPLKLMIEPTSRLMALLEEYGARLVIFADVGEILRFREYYEKTGQDVYCFRQIRAQLREAIRRGHDVQLHIHSSYFGAHFEAGKWRQNWEKYNLAGLSKEEILDIVRTCKAFLEEELKPVKPDYDCYVFRAANWSMHPTKNLAAALIENGICIDSSVYKYGKQKGWVDYDYSNAHDAAFPYRASSENICDFDQQGQIVEFPIFCELKPAPAFLSPVRLFRIWRAQSHRHDRNPKIKESGQKKGISNLFSRYLKAATTKHPRKFDFNQLTTRQMIRTLKSITDKRPGGGYITLIGHSKSFVKYNEYTLKPFLQYISRNKNEYRFSTYPPREELPC